MTQTPNEQISAFFDNEIDDAEAELVLRRLSRDQGLRDYISRYALIGEAVRRDQPARYHVAERVRAVLENEPAHTATAVSGAAGLQRFMRPLIGAAIAATVAVVAIGSLRNVPTSGPKEPVAFATSNAAAPAAVSATPVSAQASAASYTVPAVIPAGRQSVEARRQLNAYLVSHSQYAKRMGPQNIVSFRAVGYQVGSSAVPEPTQIDAGTDPEQ